VFKKKEEVVVVAVLAIIAAALLSGYGVYYFFRLRPVKIAKSQLFQKSPVSENNSIITAIPSPEANEKTASSDRDSELQSAQIALENFFNYLANEQYEEAVVLYGWGHDDDPGNNLQTWNGNNDAETFKNYCESVGTCLKIKVLTGAEIGSDEYKFIVQFLTDEGEIYEHPSVLDFETSTDFNFKVKKIDGQFKVINPPLYCS